MFQDDPFSPYDVAVVGGGPAGLTAAMYLARFLRSVVVFDAGDARANLIPCTRNCPGFPQGIAGEELLRRLRTQAMAAGGEIVKLAVEKLSRAGNRFLIYSADFSVEAHCVVLATGVVDKAPNIAGLQNAVADGVVRLCPVCDAFEARGKRVAVVGPETLAIAEAIFLRGYCRDVAMLFNYPGDISEPVRRRAQCAGIAIFDDVDNLVRKDNLLRIVRADDGPAQDVDILYVAMGCDVRSELVEMVGAQCDEEGYVIVGDDMQTSIPNLYAIGDVTRALNQISVGFGHAATAAADINKKLRCRQR
jgi:thioredoxin reductase (NADPH)